jgi:hypothetical protein
VAIYRFPGGYDLLKKEQLQIYEEAYHLQNCELAMGEFYQQMADRIPEEILFWQEAIGDKVNHARMTGRLIAMISSKPGKFMPGKFRVAVLETFLEAVYGHIEQIQQKKLTRSEVYKIALDYESSLLMTRPYDIVESAEPDYKVFRDSFAVEAHEHSQRIKQYIRQKLGIANPGTSKITVPVTSKSVAHH